MVIVVQYLQCLCLKKISRKMKITEPGRQKLDRIHNSRGKRARLYLGLLQA